MAEITNIDTSPAMMKDSGMTILYHNRVTVAQWATYTSQGLGGTAKKMIIKNPTGSGSQLRYWVGDVTPTASNYMTLEQGEAIEINSRNTYFKGSGTTISITVEVMAFN
ncbi:hypothetical protein HZA99_04680 [Candidatus Woesearchaeota archaeon]|nr:hypothetical protein [Candidatus Woesearchaeota archaeon]